MGAVKAAVLAVDGGNSCTDAVLVAADGTLLARVRGPGSNHQTSGVDTTRRVLAGLVDRAAVEAGLDPARPVAVHGAFYLAGADLAEELDLLRGIVTEPGWVDEPVVDNDTFALLRAGSEAPDRVAVVCGAGINCVGVRADGTTARFPALGRVSGDWGGGADIGQEALWLAVRAEDGRGAPTALAQAVRSHFGHPTVSAASVAFHLGVLPEERLHELVPLLFRLAREGDAVARDVVRRQAEEVALLATVALDRLGLLDRPVDVVLGGGVLAAGEELLLAQVRQRCLARAPRSRQLVVREPPVLGAALLGLDVAGASAEARRRVRDALVGPWSAAAPGNGRAGVVPGAATAASRRGAGRTG